MEYSFSIASFFWGLLIIAASVAVLYWYRQIADNTMSGVASYDRLRLYGVIGVVVGMLVTFNLHVFILTLLLGFVFHH